MSTGGSPARSTTTTVDATAVERPGASRSDPRGSARDDGRPAVHARDHGRTVPCRKSEVPSVSHRSGARGAPRRDDRSCPGLASRELSVRREDERGVSFATRERAGLQAPKVRDVLRDERSALSECGGEDLLVGRTLEAAVQGVVDGYDVMTPRAVARRARSSTSRRGEASLEEAALPVRASARGDRPPPRPFENRAVDSSGYSA